MEISVEYPDLENEGYQIYLDDFLTYKQVEKMRAGMSPEMLADYDLQGTPGEDDSHFLNMSNEETFIYLRDFLLTL
jgi:hypothetical protein